MGVPSFQEMFLPFLQFLADGKARRMQEVAESVADHFQLSPQDREEPIPSGQSSKLANRIGWCRTHLKLAGFSIGAFRLGSGCGSGCKS
jgi:restriction system protein